MRQGGELSGKWFTCDTLVSMKGSKVMETVRIGFGMRLVAALIDGVVAAVLVCVPIFLLGRVHPALGGIVGGLLAMAYYSLEIFRCQAIGKMLLQYRITNQNGAAATRDQLVKRYAYKQLPQVLGIIAAIPLLGFFSFIALAASLAILVGALMAFKPEKLALHDKLFGTAVYGPAKLSVSVPTFPGVLPVTASAAGTTKTV
jgi:uncharacterized RDD family membrane protein YckC